MNVLIVEDEALAAEKLKRQLTHLTQAITEVAWCKSVQETASFLQEHSVDLILLDIQLSDGISFQLFEQLPNLQTPIIFTTAYDAYAIKAFEVNSVDYLLKPFTQQALQRAFDKYERLRKKPEDTQEATFAYQKLAALFREQSQPTYKSRFVVSVGEQLRTIGVEEAAYFFAAQKYVFLVTPSGSQHIVDFTLDKLEELLDPATFYRINRKYLIQLSAISEMVHWTKGRVKVKLAPVPAEDVFVSVGKSAGFKEWLGK